MQLAVFALLGSTVFWLGSAIKLNTIIIIILIILLNANNFCCFISPAFVK